MANKRIYKVTTAGLDLRDVRLIEIVFKHSQYNKYEFALVSSEQVDDIDLLIANTSEVMGLDAIAKLRTQKREVPVIAALPRGAVSSTRHAISIDRLTLQLLPILNRVIDIEFNPQVAPLPAQLRSVPTESLSNLPSEPAQQPVSVSQLQTPPQQKDLAPQHLASVSPKTNLVALPSAIGPDGALIERLRVLVVDDSPTVRQQLAQAFNRMGIISEVAASAAEALARLAETSFNLALIDVVMPEMDVYKLTKEIKRNKACKQMPVIILTSRSSPFDLARGALAGCDTYLTKPVPLKDLEAAVAKQLRKALAIDDISGLIRMTQVAAPSAAQTPSLAPVSSPQLNAATPSMSASAQ